MFERFTDRARRVVVLAQEEARMLNHSHIGTEHILLGLIAEGDGVAAKAMESLEINLGAVRQQLVEIIGQGQNPASGHIPFTPRAKKVLELAHRESRALGHKYIGTEHILLGLIAEGEGVAAQVLLRLGADLPGVRQRVIEILGSYQGVAVVAEYSGPGRHGQPDLDELGARLAALERWVGNQPDLEDLDQEIGQVRREKEDAIDRQDFDGAAALRAKEKELLIARASRHREWTEAAAGRLSMARELERVNSELERLRAILREHGIEPDDDAA